MSLAISRRDLFTTCAASSAVLAVGTTTGRAADVTESASAVGSWFPSQNPQLVREMVGVSHRNLGRVKELLKVSPALAKATWDWGFGDWETALGAASHVGNRAIAETLIQHGARPDIFTFAMLGQLPVVRTYIEANPGIQRTLGPHCITLIAHAKAGGKQAAAVVKYLEDLGDADTRPPVQTLGKDDQQVYVGKYTFGRGANDLLLVSTTRTGLLAIQRGSKDSPRNLFYVGEHAFFPAGAADVRIRFEIAGGKAMSLTVIDGQPVVKASRE